MDAGQAQPLPEGAWRLYDGAWGFLDSLRKAQGAMPGLQTGRDSDSGNAAVEDSTGGSTPHR